MEKPTRRYKNGGDLYHQGEIEANSFWSADPEELFSVKGVALALDINRNKVCKIPVARRKIAKREYYRQSDIAAWARDDYVKADSLLLKLKEEHRICRERQLRQKSRIYAPGSLASSEAKLAKSKSKSSAGALPTDINELRMIIGATTSYRPTAAAELLLRGWAAPKKAE